jgi:enoyl-CoA hydratase/carnithine racemase
MSDSHVHYRIDNAIACITLDRPPVNAFSLGFLDDILAALEHARTDASVRAVLLTSDIPGRFCAGLDLDILLGKPESEIRPFLEKLYVQLWDAQCALGKPSIAVVNGAARGGGMTLAISCDVILAGESATFGYPEIDLGLLPAIHLSHLPRLIGRARAVELLFSGRSFTASEAERTGLITRTHPDEALREEATKLAAVFASKSPQAIQAGRAVMVRMQDKGYREDILAAVDEFCGVAASDAAQEGLRAFIEKRAPEWPSE